MPRFNKRFTLIIFFFSLKLSVIFAQSDALIKVLDSLKAKNNLNEWVYTRLDYAYQNPQQGLAFLIDTQKQTLLNRNINLRLVVFIS